MMCTTAIGNACEWQRYVCLIQMGSVVPRSAMGYVSDLAALSLTEELENDRLQRLAAYCPHLVSRYRQIRARQKMQKDSK
jgi:hypothetical protein